MKPVIAITFLASVMVAAVSSAAAQSESKANIPFAFQVGSTLMPAGTYIVDSSSPRALWLRGQDGRGATVAMASASTNATTAAKKLVFNRYGSRYFLSETLDAYGNSEREFAPGKLEKRIREQEASLSDEGRVLLATK
jgi:hypothetical protein